MELNDSTLAITQFIRLLESISTSKTLKELRIFKVKIANPNGIQFFTWNSFNYSIQDALLLNSSITTLKWRELEKLNCKTLGDWLIPVCFTDKLLRVDRIISCNQLIFQVLSRLTIIPL